MSAENSLLFYYKCIKIKWNNWGGWGLGKLSGNICEMEFDHIFEVERLKVDKM